MAVKKGTESPEKIKLNTEYLNGNPLDGLRVEGV